MEDDLKMIVSIWKLTVSIWKMTVSIWKMTVSIWDILSLWAEYAHHVTASQSGTLLEKQKKR